MPQWRGGASPPSTAGGPAQQQVVDDGAGGVELGRQDTCGWTLIWRQEQNDEQILLQLQTHEIFRDEKDAKINQVPFRNEPP